MRLGWFGCSIVAGALLVARSSFAASGDPAPPPPAPSPVTSAPVVAAPPALEPRPGASAPSIEWDPRWRPSSMLDYTVSGISAAGALGALAVPPKPTQWTKPDAFDKSARDALRLKSSAARDNARDVSDAFLTMSVNTLVVDSLAVAWWGHDRRAIAWELNAMDAEALSITAFVQGMVSGLTSRERPYFGECVGPFSKQSTNCRSNNRYRSFFSGHTSITFTVAGLTCQHHAHLPLYGGGAPDAIACLASLALAGTTGYLRVASDQHYLTDVMVGAGFGSLSGFLVPWIFHYRTRAGAAPPFAAALPNGGYVTLAPVQNGAGIAGAF